MKTLKGALKFLTAIIYIFKHMYVQWSVIIDFLEEF